MDNVGNSDFDSGKHLRLKFSNLVSATFLIVNVQDERINQRAPCRAPPRPAAPRPPTPPPAQSPTPHHAPLLCRCPDDCHRRLRRPHSVRLQRVAHERARAVLAVVAGKRRLIVTAPTWLPKNNNKKTRCATLAGLEPASCRAELCTLRLHSDTAMTLTWRAPGESVSPLPRLLGQLIPLTGKSALPPSRPFSFPSRSPASSVPAACL